MKKIYAIFISNSIGEEYGFQNFLKLVQDKNSLYIEAFLKWLDDPLKDSALKKDPLATLFNYHITNIFYEKRLDGMIAFEINYCLECDDPRNEHSSFTKEFMNGRVDAFDNTVFMDGFYSPSKEFNEKSVARYYFGIRKPNFVVTKKLDSTFYSLFTGNKYELNKAKNSHTI